MKKIIDFFMNTLKHLFTLLLILILVFIVYIFCVSQKNDLSISDTIYYVKSIGSEFVGISTIDKNIIDISASENLALNNEYSTNSKNFKYYYEQLDNPAKIIYISLENNIDNLKKEKYSINLYSQFNDLLHEPNGEYKLNQSFQSALDAFFYDYPELFYIDLTKITLYIKYVSIGSKTTYTVSIVPQDNKSYLLDEFKSEEDVNQAIALVENIKNTFLSKISDSDNYNKILKTHDALVNSLKYSSNSKIDNSHNIYGALVEKEVVCEGYAKAFKYFLDSLDIESILVSGTATNSTHETESHMWNYVKINNAWYAFDLTWDDPIIIGGKTKNTIRHDYFFKGSMTFVTSHNPSGKISDTGMLFTLPKLSKKNYK